MHHEQDMRKMGGLAKYMPITSVTMLDRRARAGRHAVLPGYYSKDAIIEAVGASHRGVRDTHTGACCSACS